MILRYGASQLLANSPPVHVRRKAGVARRSFLRLLTPCIISTPTMSCRALNKHAMRITGTASESSGKQSCNKTLSLKAFK